MRLIKLLEIDSTNREASRLLEAGQPPGFAISADRQTAARGRLQRAWQTLSGNVALTITAPWNAGHASGPTIALTTGLAIRNVIARVVGVPDMVSIKWPNDILIEGRKVAGTLIEADDAAVRIGIGINVASLPTGMPYPVACLRQYACIDSQELIELVLTEWRSTYEIWVENGFSAFRTDYNRHIHFRNRPMRLSLDREKQAWISGVCRGVDEHGRLVIESMDGCLTTYSIGDVDGPGLNAETTNAHANT